MKNAGGNFEGSKRTMPAYQEFSSSFSVDSAEQFRLLVESVQDYAIFLLDTEGRVRSWNAGAERIKGYTASEVLGEHFSRFHPPEEVSAGRPEELLRAAARDGRVESEGWRLRRDGTAFWANVVITALRDESGELVGYAKVTRDLTERRNTELELLDSAQQLRSTLDALGTAIAILDERGIILTTNQAWDQLARHPDFAIVSGSEGADYTRICDGIGAEDAPSAREICAGIRATLAGEREDFLLEYSWQSAGRTCWFEVRMRRFTGLNGPRLVVTHRNTTAVRLAIERQRRIAHEQASRAAAEAAQQRIEDTLESITDGFFALDRERCFTYVNRRAEAIFGRLRGDLLGRPLREEYPEAIGSRFEEELATALASGTPSSVEEHFTARDAWLEFHIFPSPDGVSVYVRDISERKRAERYQELLARSGPVLSSTLDHEQTVARAAELGVQLLANYCCIYVLDESGGIERMACAHAESEPTEHTGVLARYPVDRERPHPLLEAIETREPVLHTECSAEMVRSWAQDEEHLRALEALAPRSCIAVPLLARGRLLGGMFFVATGTVYSSPDVPIAEDLARRVALALDNARLYEDAQQAIRARDNVLRVVSHDLRNPLNTISLTTEMLLDPSIPQSPEQREKQLQIIRRSTDRMAHLVEDLLDAARIEAGALLLEQNHQSAARLIEEAIELNQPAATARGQMLEHEIAGALPPVYADRNRMLQVFSNLIGNAIKFTPEGGRVTVRAESVGGVVRFAVVDTGPGLSAEHQRHLFQPFWQARHDGRGGAGLGLGIARGIVEKHGGRIWVESEEGAGTTVYFTLPPAEERRARLPAS